MSKIAIIGECMLELSGAPFSDQITQGFGGDTLNSALYLKYLSPETKVHYVTALGEDELSQGLLKRWAELGIETQQIAQFKDLNPGLYWIHLNSAGERTFSYWRKGSAASQWLKHPDAPKILAEISNMEWLYLSGISLAILDSADRRRLLDFLAHYQAQGGKILFDSNYRPQLWESKEVAQKIYREVLALTHLALLTDEDEMAIWNLSEESLLTTLRRYYPTQTLIIKQGALGATMLTEEGEFPIPAPKVANVVDTTAAGDAFNAGCMAQLLAGASLADACRFGHKVAGIVIQHRGAIVPKETFFQQLKEDPL